MLSFTLLFVILCTGCGSDGEKSVSGSENPAVEQGSSEENAGDTMLSSEDGSEAEDHDDAMTQEDASEWEDHVLLTRKAPLADGRTFTLEVVGKRLDEYGYGVREVRVYDGDTLIQSVFTAEGNVEDQRDWFSDLSEYYSQERLEYWEQLLSDIGEELSADEVDSLPENMKYTESRSIGGTVEVLDLNFDGNADFGLYGGTGLDSMDVYSYWSWNEEEEQYCYIGTMKGVELHPEEGELISQGRPEGNSWERCYYRPDENGELMIERWEIMWAGPERGTNPEFDWKPLWEVWMPREGEKFSPRSLRKDSLVLSHREVLVKEVYDDGTASYFLEIWELEDGVLQMTSREEYDYE